MKVNVLKLSTAQSTWKCRPMLQQMQESVGLLELGLLHTSHLFHVISTLIFSCICFTLILLEVHPEFTAPPRGSLLDPNYHASKN